MYWAELYYCVVWTCRFSSKLQLAASVWRTAESSLLIHCWLIIHPRPQVHWYYNVKELTFVFVAFFAYFDILITCLFIVLLGFTGPCKGPTKALPPQQNWYWPPNSNCKEAGLNSVASNPWGQFSLVVAMSVCPSFGPSVPSWIIVNYAQTVKVSFCKIDWYTQNSIIVSKVTTTLFVCENSKFLHK